MLVRGPQTLTIAIRIALFTKQIVLQHFLSYFPSQLHIVSFTIALLQSY